ncbi:hypothetical protein FM036_09605 [Nostoc sp. HG1]|nr:hypothetical protein [Nostoc sp. HG1]
MSLPYISEQGHWVLYPYEKEQEVHLASVNIDYKFAFETFSICPVKYASSCLSCCASSNPF